jgi:hypothetical protein
MKTNRILVFGIGILIAALVFGSTVSAATIIQDTRATVTQNSFTTKIDTPQNWYRISYWTDNSKSESTPVTYTAKSATTITIKVPCKWQSKMIYYQVCTWQDQYGNHGDCGRTFSVQLSEKAQVKKTTYTMHYNRHNWKR